jgi:hypothetical protein
VFTASGAKIGGKGGVFGGNSGNKLLRWGLMQSEIIGVVTTSIRML